MKKEKIAISMAPQTLALVDAMVDGLTLRSRSQAIEYLVSSAIEHQYIKEAVILIRGREAATLLKQVKGESLLAQQAEWLRKHGVQEIYLVVGENPSLGEIRELTKELNIKLIVEEKEQGTVKALKILSETLHHQFVVLLGDTLIDFDLTKMILFHLRQDKTATVGLISSNTPEKFSRVELEGDRIVEFRRTESDSHIIDAGVYLFKPTIFNHLVGKLLDQDVFPELCHTNDIKGYFTRGEYLHFGD